MKTTHEKAIHRLRSFKTWTDLEKRQAEIVANRPQSWEIESLKLASLVVQYWDACGHDGEVPEMVKQAEKIIYGEIISE